jgi:DNA-binding NarL/FixJ family response regulator
VSNLQFHLINATQATLHRRTKQRSSTVFGHPTLRYKRLFALSANAQVQDFVTRRKPRWGVQCWRGFTTGDYPESSLNGATAICELLVVDDHGIVREGLIAMLNRHGDIHVVGSAATGSDAIHAAQRLKPAVIIMDLVLPDMSGTDAAERILARLPSTRIIILSAHHTIEHVYHALRAGAMGYIGKNSPPSELILAIRAVRVGKQFISPQLTPSSVDHALFYSLPKSPLERLSCRERDVLRQLVAGGSSADIAQQLSLSRKTIDTYRGRLMAKLGVRNRSALIRFALENELVV